VKFSKYSSAGNDFVVMQWDASFNKLLDQSMVKKLCHRNFGVGADGLIILRNADRSECDFKMQYFNSDGIEAEMCGNGARAACLFMKEKTSVPPRDEISGYSFQTKNGVYEGTFLNSGEIELKMSEVDDLNAIELQNLFQGNNIGFIRVGVPHVVLEVGDGLEFDLELALKIRNDKRFEFGTNVNFVKQLNENTISVRTFERGVEAETLSCGTGVTACGIMMMTWNKLEQVNVLTTGGRFKVIKRSGSIYLVGKTNHLFDGNLTEDFFK